MKPVRLGVIGLGLIWLREHQPRLARFGDTFELVAFCDVNPERRAAAMAAFPGAPVVDDYRTLLALPEVEAVLVLTPIAFNAPVALAALQAGKDVIMEKPISRSVAEGERLVAAARQARRRLIVAEQLAYRQADTILLNLLASGAIGDLILWNRIQHVDADPAQGALRYETTPWRKTPDYPLGALFDGGIHLIASLSRVFGAPAAVFARGRKLRPDYGEYDQVTMLFEYGAGPVGMLSHATMLSPMQNVFHIHGATGVLTVERSQIVVEQSGQPSRIVDLPDEDMRDEMWQAIATAFRTGAEPYYTAERALQDVAILEAVDRSIKQNQQVHLTEMSAVR